MPTTDKANVKPAIVYMAINLINGKRYIGVTCRSLEKRKREHLYQAMEDGRLTLIGRAISKYGFSMFKFTVLAKYETRLEACIAEIDLIERFQPEYNMTRGGESILGLRVPKNPNWVQCLNDGKVFPSYNDAALFYNIGRKAVSISALGKGENNNRLFFVHSGEFGLSEVDRMSLLNGRTETHPPRRKKKEKTRFSKFYGKAMRPVICVTTGERFINAFKAAEKLGTSHGNIRKAAATGGLCMGKYRIRYEDLELVLKTPRKYPEESREKARQIGLANKEKWSEFAKLGPMSLARRVVCLDDGVVHESGKAAARYYDLDHGALSELCNGKRGRKTLGGKRFKYLESSH